MEWTGIVRYTLSALLFALVAGMVCLAALRWRKKRPLNRRDILQACAAGYLAGLIQITALRIGLMPIQWLGGTLCAVPLRTMMREAQSGLWPLIYHAVGNMIWFVPLGWLLPALKPGFHAGATALSGAALSVAIECVQFLLGTGVSDADDVWLNALGALVGFCLYRAWRYFAGKLRSHAG